MEDYQEANISLPRNCSLELGVNAFGDLAIVINYLPSDVYSIREALARLMASINEIS